MSRITLSIVVPTYNRAELLNCLLVSIVKDFTQWPSDLELIVIDNASTDETSAIISRFADKNFPIQYLVNEKNIGMDGNLAACFDVASGKYFWQVGDDEIMYRGTVQYVLELCRNQEFGVLHLASKGFTNGQQAEISLLAKPNRVEAEVLDSKKLFRLANVFLTFISANVINRQAVLMRFPNFDTKAELNTNLPQLAWTFSALKASDVHCYIGTPLLGALAGNTGGYKLIEVFGVNLINITKKYLHDLIPNAERIMSNAVLIAVLPGGLMSQHSKSNLTSKFEHENVIVNAEACFKGFMYFKIFIRPILSNSNFKRKVAFFLVRVANRVNRKLKYFFL